ncbi:hypothetical protein V2G26_009189 [Clonostachys chloroleuca]
MSIDLKYIPCPAGNKCTAFMCIFGHESDKDKQKEKQTSLSSDVTQKSAPSDHIESCKTAAGSQPGTAPPRPRKLSQVRRGAALQIPSRQQLQDRYLLRRSGARLPNRHQPSLPSIPQPQLDLSEL